MIAKRSDPRLSATLLVVSIATLGRAMQVGDGILKEGTIAWLAIAFLACIAGTVAPGARGRATYGRAELVGAIVVTLICQIGQMLTRTPFNGVHETDTWFATFRWGVAGAGLLCGAVLVGGGWVRHVAFVMLLVIHALLGDSVIRASPQPDIDVFIFQRDSAEALVQRTNPYTVTFPDIIGSEWYGEGISLNGRLQFGYPYMPLTLLLSLPGHLLGGDYRYALLGATTLSAAMIAYAGPSTFSFGAAALLLLLPRGMYILERGWSEPVVVLMLCATVFCAIRLPRAMPWMLGLFLASKQYVPLTIGAAVLLVRRERDRRDTARSAISHVSQAALAAIVVTLPFVLWNIRAFWHSAVELQFQQPFRWDSLSFVAWWMAGERRLPSIALVFSFMALASATALILWRCGRTVAGFAAGVALVLFAFFAFNKQAFGNYYYVVIAAMCCAVATVEAENWA